MTYLEKEAVFRYLLLLNYFNNIDEVKNIFYKIIYH